MRGTKYTLSIMANTIYFGSNAKPPYFRLSNFFKADICFCDSLADHHALGFFKTAYPVFMKVLKKHRYLVFPSVEHAYQSLWAKTEKALLCFTKGGTLGRLTIDAMKIFFPKNAEKKLTYWSKKRMVGILAQMASREKHKRKLGWTDDMYDYTHGHAGPNAISDETRRKTFIFLLLLKFRTHAALRKTLLSTQDRPLVERVISAKRKYEETGRQEIWGGMWDKDTNTFYGLNLMGKYMEHVRRKLTS